jgi:hypothetical protein
MHDGHLQEQGCCEAHNSIGCDSFVQSNVCHMKQNRIMTTELASSVFITQQQTAINMLIPIHWMLIAATDDDP